MAETCELPLTLPAPEVSEAEVARLLACLRTKEAWTTAAEIAGELGLPFTDRRVRKIASAAAPDVVSFPGSPGYKLWARCTVEEINHCIEAFESQGKDMIKRAVAYRQAYHRRFRGATQP